MIVGNVQTAAESLGINVLVIVFNARKTDKRAVFDPLRFDNLLDQVGSLAYSGDLARCQCFRVVIHLPTKT